MKDILAFMGEHPFFTFFMALIVLQTVIYVAKYVAYAVRGDPNIIKNNEDED